MKGLHVKNYKIMVTEIEEDLNKVYGWKTKYC